MPAWCRLRTVPDPPRARADNEERRDGVLSLKPRAPPTCPPGPSSNVRRPCLGAGVLTLDLSPRRARTGPILSSSSEGGRCPSRARPRALAARPPLTTSVVFVVEVAFLPDDDPPPRPSRACPPPMMSAAMPARSGGDARRHHGRISARRRSERSTGLNGLSDAGGAGRHELAAVEVGSRREQHDRDVLEPRLGPQPRRRRSRHRREASRRGGSRRGPRHAPSRLRTARRQPRLRPCPPPRGSRGRAGESAPRRRLRALWSFWSPLAGRRGYTPTFASLVPRRRKLEREARPFPFGGVHPDASAHRQHQLFRDEETEPRARGAVPRGRLGAVELPADPVTLGGGNPDSLVDTGSRRAVRERAPAPSPGPRRPCT